MYYKNLSCELNYLGSSPCPAKTLLFAGLDDPLPTSSPVTHIFGIGPLVYAH